MLALSRCELGSVRARPAAGPSQSSGFSLREPLEDYVSHVLLELRLVYIAALLGPPDRVTIFFNRRFGLPAIQLRVLLG